MSNVEQLDFSSIGEAVAPDVSAATITKNIKQKLRNKQKHLKKKSKKKQDKQEAVDKYSRGDKNDTKGIRSFQLRKTLKSAEVLAQKSEEAAFKAEILLPDDAGYVEAEGMEETWRFTQEGLQPHVDARSARKMFNLELTQFGPYVMDYTRNGRHIVMGGRKGHVATFDWQKFSLTHELHLRETIRDIKFLHNENMYACAQKKYVYIYDNSGIELHCLRNLIDVNIMQFLPYHFLLACAGKNGMVQYTDTSTGAHVAEHKPRLGEVKVMSSNPRNAILHCGHNNGSVTLWSPNQSTPLVKMLCHKAAVLALEVDVHGNYMATSGLDGQVKVWDIRTYKEVHSYFTVRPASTLDLSDMGMLALGYGSHVTVWKDALRTKQKSPYLREEFPGKTVQRVKFCPFEDVLAVSHSKGFTSLVIPGAGEPNFDTFEANPFESKKQRREKTVVSLLEKLQPDMITLDQSVFGLMDKDSKHLFDSNRRATREAAEAAVEVKEKHRMRGKSRSSKRYKRKRKNIIDKETEERNEKIAKFAAKKINHKKELDRKATGLPTSTLDRFT